MAQRRFASRPRVLGGMALILVGLVALGGIRSAFAQQVSSFEIQKSLACFCGCKMTLEGCQSVMTCPEGVPLKKEIEEYIRQGKNKEEILAAFVGKYGESILAAPTKRGFNLTAWVLPFLLISFGAGLLYTLARAWAAKSTPTDTEETKANTVPFDPNYEARFEEELKKFEA